MKEAGLVLVSIIVFGVAACGGPDKPPLTPDQDMSMDGGADPTSAPASTDTPAATPPK